MSMFCGACAMRSAIRRGSLLPARRLSAAVGDGPEAGGDGPGAGSLGTGPGGDGPGAGSLGPGPGGDGPGAGSLGPGPGGDGPGPGSSPLRRLVRGSRAGAGAGGWHTAPYTRRQGAGGRQTEAPEHTSVVLFPGQGSQYVGMGLKVKDVPAARELYDLASNILGWDVWSVCTSGPEPELVQRAQECVVVSSLAALEAAREGRAGALGGARAAAGHSAGQFGALVFAGALSLEAALRVLAVRAAAMRALAAARPGGMLAVWAPCGLDVAGWAAREAGAAGGAAWLAGRLYAGCRLVAGDLAGLAALQAGARAAGLRRVERLPVGGPWHCPLMGGVEAPVRAALGAVELRAPRLAVVCCSSGRPLTSAAAVRGSLARLAARPVNWEAALHALYARPRALAQPLTLALGPGSSMRSTLRQVNARAWDCSVQIDI